VTPYYIESRHNGPESEAQIQAAFLAQMAKLAPRVMVLGIPNAGKRTRWEAMQRKREGMITGFPDVLLFFDGGVMACEFKSGKGVLSKPQAAVLDRLVDLGIQVAVMRRAETAVEFVRNRWPHAFSV
jgi:hypothetical protein